MADVFVSYARTDKERVAPLVAAIEAQGLSVWWDPEIAAGQQFDDQIEVEMNAARAVLVVWTPTSVASRWVRGEAREAADRGILVPVRFDGARLPMDVRALHTTDLDNWGDNSSGPQFQEVLRALGSMMARTGASSGGRSPSSFATGASTTRTSRVSICVLPFANMSGEAEQEYFSDGICEDIITDLSKVSALAVVSRNTAFTFKGKNVDVSQVARQLKVTHVLEGSVRKAGDRVRISAQLIEGSKDEHVWAERYDRNVNDIFALQDEISEAIVKALKLQLLPEEKKAIEQRGTDNVEAYSLYLMARHHATGYMGDVRKSETVIRLCRAAIELDPNYARAWAMLANAQRMRLYSTSEGDDGSQAASRALALDENLAEAHVARAGILASRGEYDAAQVELDTAIRQNPESVDAHREAGRLRFLQRRFADAIPHLEKVSTLVEADYVYGNLLITCYMALGDLEGVRRTARSTLVRTEKAIAIEPDNGSALGAMSGCLLALGETDRAKDLAKRAVLFDPDNRIMRYNLACDLIVNMRDFETALEFLAPVFKKGGKEQLAWLKSDPDLDALRDDPRFAAMLEEAETRLAATNQGNTALAN